MVNRLDFVAADSSDAEADQQSISMDSSDDEGNSHAPIIVNASKVELQDMLIDDVDDGDVIVKEKVVIQEMIDEESSDLDLQEEHDQVLPIVSFWSFLIHRRDEDIF